MKNLYYKIQLAIFSGMFAPWTAYAQLSRPTQSYGLVHNHSFAGVIGGVINWTLTILGSLSILVIVISGIIYITSGGDDGRVETAKKMLTYAIVGLVVALLGYVIVRYVGTALGSS